jgi:hypothetical protein
MFLKWNIQNVFGLGVDVKRSAGAKVPGDTG